MDAESAVGNPTLLYTADPSATVLFLMVIIFSMAVITVVGAVKGV
jgi:hypothetical protein